MAAGSCSQEEALLPCRLSTQRMFLSLSQDLFALGRCHIPGLNLILCGDKKWFPSKSHISYFFLHFFFPQMIWQFQPSLASCWKQMYFSLKQGWRWDTAPFSANGFASGSHPSAIAHCPRSPGMFVSRALKPG